MSIHHRTQYCSEDFYISKMDGRSESRWYVPGQNCVTSRSTNQKTYQSLHIWFVPWPFVIKQDNCYYRHPNTSLFQSPPPMTHAASVPKIEWWISEENCLKVLREADVPCVVWHQATLWRAPLTLECKWGKKQTLQDKQTGFLSFKTLPSRCFVLTQLPVQ